MWGTSCASSAGQALERLRQGRTGGAVWAGEDRVKGEGIEQALLPGGSPAAPDDLRKRFDTLMNERCKGKDASKRRFVIE